MSTISLHLRSLIGRYLCGELDLPELWRLYTSEWADAHESEFTEAETLFFGEVADRLHYADWTSPPESFLEDPSEFQSWLASAVARAGAT